MLQVGEKTRFVDELEYLLEELQVKGKPNFGAICASLDELIGKSCLKANAHSNSFFGLQLKSHGVLLSIFESLAPGGELVENDRVHLRLLVLIGYLLHDVRRLDFFLPNRSALKLARFCLLRAAAEERPFPNDENWTLLEHCPVFTNNAAIKNHRQHQQLHFLGIWILTKMTLASLNLPKDDRFCVVLADADDVCAALFACLFAPFDAVIRDRAAALLDALFTVSDSGTFAAVPDDLIPRLVTEAADRKSVTAFKFAVSLTGSPEGAAFLARSPACAWMPTLKLLLLSPVVHGDAFQPLALSCLVNLLDRVPESVLDELRVQDADSCSFLEQLASLFEGTQSLLLALAITFSAHQNKTNAEVIKACWKDKRAELCAQLRAHVQAFLADQQCRSKRVKIEEIEQEKKAFERLEEAVLFFEH